MKVALLTIGEDHQIMFEPESKSEKAIIELLKSNKDINVISGEYGDNEKAFGMFPQRCNGGYYRQFSKAGCVMIVVTPKKEQIND